MGTSPTQPLISTPSNPQIGGNQYGSTLERPRTVADQTPSIKDDPHYYECPQMKVSLVSFLTYSWMDPLFRTGYKRQLQEEDLWDMAPQWTAGVVGPELTASWKNEKARAAAKNQRPSLLRALVRFILPYYWIIEFLRATQDTTSPPSPLWHGYALAAALFVVSMAISIVNMLWEAYFVRTAILARTALVDMIFKKATTMSSKARLDNPDSKVFNLMSTDTVRIEDSIEGVLFLLVIPLGTLITVAMLWYLIGPSSLLGAIVLMVSNPAQAWAMTKLHSIRERASKLTDSRIFAMTEILQAIKVIKLYAWEKSFLVKLSEIRLSEIKCLSTLMQVRGFIYSTSSAADAYVSAKRIEEFLLSEDLAPLPPVVPTHPYALSIKDADFYWDQLPSAASDSEGTSDETQERQPLLYGQERNLDASDLTFLRNINLDIPRGALVAIVGPVGSGKSSLLQGMVGNMMMSRGTVVRGASIGYASQTPWIQNATVRDNILFDTPFDEKRYWKVVKACSLEKDLSTFANGDLTEIGERGVNLSGGQKARLSLARSVYYNADIIIMDDPLSAVDAHVGKRLWEDCVFHELTGKTRIVATHQLHVLPDVDYVVCLENGCIVDQGTYQELIAKKTDFYTLMKTYGGHEHDDDGKKLRRRRLSRSVSAGKTIVQAASDSDDEITVLLESTEPSTEEDKKVVPGGQMTEEERAYGAVSTHVYKSYFDLGGHFYWAFVVFLIFAQQAVGVAMNVWLSYWTEDKLSLSKWAYIEIYVGAGVVQMIVVMTGSFMLVVAVLKSSRVMHDHAFVSVLNSPMSFFDTTPLGRILNRFSKDLSTIDNTLMNSFSSLMIAIAGILSMLILSAVLLPGMAPIVVILTLAYYYGAAFYQATSREMKRLDSNLRSHLFSYFSEMLTGLGTLKAYHEHGIDKAIGRNQFNLDRSNKAYYQLSNGARWIGFRVYLVGHLLNLAAVVLMVYTRTTMDPATAGLILSYLARLSSELSWAVQCFAIVENNMSSAERLMYYAENLDQEPPAEKPESKPPGCWPEHGEIVFKNVSMRYRPELPLVLNNVSFDIQAGDKIGVVGRTGAGKSSLIQALFLLVLPETGEIRIDGVETGSIGTADLRSKIAIIPQDPVLFLGTFRYNLDPLGRYTEQELWLALEAVDLKNYVRAQEGGLDASVSAQGENLSVGQRQLVCLARALLTKAKVVVLDEATASVDLATDSLIQKAIRVDFASSTVITIAHRLNTVVDYTRIIVMEQGQVSEYDTPATLLDDRESAFSKMVDETGAKNAALLRTLAGCKLGK
ncbi:Multidrug resistance-associated protein 1 [Podila minutissima]|uniref:Multidrug resistance-associated protein 1 n=1 Tax=Podila minutissima TaxID=64525 RepID=A0A9P5VKK7_9FUNG|nr:Multidrug resistance-associated protein 1 [Podila minutissima]